MEKLRVFDVSSCVQVNFVPYYDVCKVIPRKMHMKVTINKLILCHAEQYNFILDVIFRLENPDAGLVVNYWLALAKK